MSNARPIVFGDVMGPTVSITEEGDEVVIAYGDTELGTSDGPITLNTDEMETLRDALTMALEQMTLSK